MYLIYDKVFTCHYYNIHCENVFSKINLLILVKIKAQVYNLLFVVLRTFNNTR
jgi:hypothetical protein